MICIHHLKKKYEQDDLLLDIDRLVLPEHGLIALVGPSGCGKTTLLNILAGMDGNYEGKVEINHRYLSKTGHKNDRFRLEHIGYIMQHYGLFEEDTALDNVTLPARTLYHRHQKQIRQRGLDLLKAVGLSLQPYKRVKHFSGGEKQRIAIARSLINQPRMILADEPTGALDQKTKIDIMNILSWISQSRLVVVVSHDVELMNNYATEMLYFKNGKIVKRQITHAQNTPKRMGALSLQTARKKIELPFSFLVAHHYMNQKHHPIRSGVSLFASSLGLVGLGLGLILSLTVTTYLKNNLTRAFPEQSIIIESKHQDSSPFHNVSIEEIAQDQTLGRYKDQLQVFYNVNYEQLFPHLNRVVIASTPKKYVVDGLSIRQVNEVMYIQQGLMLPGRVLMPYLEYDQVVLGVNYPLLNLFYSALKLPERTIESLRLYIQKTGLSLAFELANDAWQYGDEQMIEVKEVVLIDTPRLFHTTRHWNSWFFKDQMRFPSTFIKNDDEPPWMLYEQVIIETQGTIHDFISQFRQTHEASDWVFETLTEIEAHDYILIEQRLKIYKINLNASHLQLKKDLTVMSEHQPILFSSTNQGYRVFKDALLSGFANPMILSTSEPQIEDMLEHTIFDEGMLASQWRLNPGLSFGHYLQTTRGGFDFRPIINFMNVRGEKPIKANEIILSTTLAKAMGISHQMKEPILLYGAYVIVRPSLSSGHPIPSVHRFTLSVVGLIQSDQQSIYQSANWLDDFFRFSVGLQNYDLVPQQWVWKMKENIPIQTTIDNLSQKYLDYTFTSPTYDVFSTIDATMIDIERIVFSIALITIVISFLLNSLVNYLSVQDALYQIGLLGYLGVPANERLKLVVVSALLQGGQSFVMATVELIVLQQVIAAILRQELGYIGEQPLLLGPYVVIALFAFGISLCSSFFASYRLSRLTPMEALRR